MTPTSTPDTAAGSHSANPSTQKVCEWVPLVGWSQKCPISGLCRSQIIERLRLAPHDVSVISGRRHRRYIRRDWLEGITRGRITHK